MEPANPIPQMPSLQVSPQSVAQPKMNLALIGVIVLLLILLGGSTYQILSLQKQVTELKKAASQPTIQPTPGPTETDNIVPVQSGVISPAPSGGTNEPLELIGTIQKSEVEGECWIIRADSPQCTGERCSLGLAAPYQPINLPDELKKIGIKAKFKLEVLSDVVTTCQVGPAVKILDYQIVK